MTSNNGAQNRAITDATQIASQATTPASVQIKPRNRSHDIAEALQGEWLDQNAFLTAVFNGMSITFPAGEKFFIDSVRHFAGDVTDPVLKDHIKGFCGQEGFHRREHQRYNEALCDARGYDLAKLEGKLTRRLVWAQKNLSPLQNLAITVAIEHFTAVLAELLLRPESVMNNADPAMRDLWRWHSAEEMEHKSVAFDVYRAVGGSEALRVAVMKRASFFIGFELMRATFYILRKDKQLFNFSLWRRGLAGLFGEHGAFKGGWAPYKEFYAQDFHPWQQDTRQLLVDWAAEAPRDAPHL
ncbi:MAG: putative metal-dependent hydrolase [Glaciecola sp.]|jgi:predicted metal-dependent hydrolase|uniref:metal-dependent hydrolase n=1 Tax=Congregibacter sp. TaxID=2744308 RepID=UPI0039E66950